MRKRYGPMVSRTRWSAALPTHRDREGSCRVALVLVCVRARRLSRVAQPRQGTATAKTFEVYACFEAGGLNGGSVGIFIPRMLNSCEVRVCATSPEGLCIIRLSLALTLPSPLSLSPFSALALSILPTHNPPLSLAHLVHYLLTP